MNYNGDNNQCDICASKGCVNCTGPKADVKSLDMLDMYYCGAQFAELECSLSTGEIKVNPIDRSTIKDIGILTLKQARQCEVSNTPFSFNDKKYTEILGDDLDLIVSGGIHFWKCDVVKKIVAYMLKNMQGVEEK
jgi:hypothetical protein